MTPTSARASVTSQTIAVEHIRISSGRPFAEVRRKLARLSQLATRIGVSTAKKRKNASPVKGGGQKSRRSEDLVAFHVG